MLKQVGTSDSKVNLQLSSFLLVKFPCPAGWFLNGMSCYKESENVKRWSTAKQDCHASGGYLMKIDDKSEQHFIEMYFRITGILKVQDVSIS